MPTTEPARSPSILIAESNVHLLEALPDVVRLSVPRARLDVCSSHDQVLRKLKEWEYDTVISNVRLTDANGSFLKRHAVFKPYVPLVLTAGASDKEPAAQALEQGAFDVIVNPLQPEQAATTIRLALWHCRLLRLIHSKERMMEKYRQHMMAFPRDEKHALSLKGTLSTIQSTLSAVMKSVDLMNKPDSSSAVVSEIEAQVRAQALERLNALCKEAAKDVDAHPPSPATVLMIDDSSTDLLYWTARLRDVAPYYSVFHAASVHEGLSLCQSRKIDCVVLDLDMEESSGFEALVSLVPDRARPTMPVVILTRLPSRMLHDLAREHGARACLVKQKATARDLSECIQKAIADIATLR